MTHSRASMEKLCKMPCKVAEFFWGAVPKTVDPNIDPSM